MAGLGGLGVAGTDIQTWMVEQANVEKAHPYIIPEGQRAPETRTVDRLAEIHDAAPMDAVTGMLLGFTHRGVVRDPGFQRRQSARRESENLTHPPYCRSQVSHASTLGRTRYNQVTNIV